MATNADLARRPALDTNPFERVVATRQRPRFSIAPISVAWNAVAFRVSGDRECVACVPRVELPDFLDKLDAGTLDAPIERFLAQPPTGRVLRAASQTGSTGLFDELSSPDAIVPSERIPGRGPLGLGGRGGRPGEARRNKNRKGRHGPSRALLAVGAVVAVVVIAAGIAVAASGGGGSEKAAVVATTSTAPTTTTLPKDAVIAKGLAGTWTVTRTVTASDNDIQPVGEINVVTFTITSNCTVTPCRLHLEAPGSRTSHTQSDLTLAGDGYEGAIVGSSPCTDHDTGELKSISPISGSISLTPTGTDQFVGVLNSVIGATLDCEQERHLTLTLVGQRG